MTSEDQGQLERLIERGITPRMHINVQNTFTNGPVETANVVGEIRGSEHPEQIFVVGGHLDSWDLSQGTTDNGSGTAATLGAADTILRAGLRPRRTLRFVLFTGEEQGLDGSFAYYRQHKAEWANHLGDLILDEGQGIVKELMLGGRDDLLPAMEVFADSVSNLRKVKVNDKIESGTDTLPFSVYGLPGINMNQDTADYNYTHHSAADALEAQKPDILAQNSTIMAMTAYWIADRPERLAEPWSDEKTAKMLRSQHEFEELKAFNLWPYGDLGLDKSDAPNQ
jgi:Zn-dependent M28 family amino/carboxypeptidase